MAILNLEVKIIADSELQKIIDSIVGCMCANGLKFPEIKIGQPGIGALIEALIRSLEASLIASWKPMIKLIQVIVSSLKKGVKAPAEFLKQVASLVSGLADLAGIEKLLKALLCEVAGPMLDLLMIPMPNIDILLDILMGRLTLKEVICKFPEYLAAGKIMMSNKLNTLDNTAHNIINSIDAKTFAEEVLQLWKIPVNGAGELLVEMTPIFKILTLVLFPLKFAQGLIRAVIKMVEGLVTNIFKGVAEMSKLLSDPASFILKDFIGGKVLKPILTALLTEFIPPFGVSPAIGEAIGEVVNYVIRNIMKLDTAKFMKWLCSYTIKVDGHDVPLIQIIGLLLGFVQFIICVLKWFFCFILDVSNMINMLMFPITNNMKDGDKPPAKPKTTNQTDAVSKAAPPPIASVSYNYSTKTLFLDGSSLVVDKTEKIKLSTLYKKGTYVEFMHGTLGKKYKVEIANVDDIKNALIFKTDPTIGEDWVKDGRGQDALVNGQKTLLGKNDTIGDKDIGVKKVKK